jgi:hypothetical protein
MTHHISNDPRKTAEHLHGESGGRESQNLSRAASEKAQSALSGQKSQLVQQIHSTADAIHESADRLHEKNLTTAAAYTERMADKLKDVADYIEDKSIRQIADGIGGMARRQPVYAMTGAFALGLLAARFFKASPRRGSSGFGTRGGHSYESSMEDYGSSYRRVPEVPVTPGSPLAGPEV